MAFKKVDPKQNFPKMEEEILKFWEENKIFEKSLENRKNSPLYVFYDGPPFATGTPHYGHLVASTMKDIVPRYFTMRGFYVPRKWGWDCHGLPIENIVEKELGSRAKKDIEKMGVEKFNELCRSKVLKYVAEWKKTIRRFGRWADMENPYVTMDLPFMESVWWVFKELYDKGLIYEGYHSMLICPRCETTLSQSEVAEGYKIVKDLSATVKFELADEPGTYVLAWTTTPWTLIGNVALAIGKNIKYVKVICHSGLDPESSVKNKDDSLDSRLRENDSKESFILAEDRLEEIFKDKEYEIISEFKGKDLVGKKYKPLFDYYAKDEKIKNHAQGWKIYAGDFVTTEEGTGVVHIAPAFGEDDMNMGKEYNLPFIQHVGMDGIIKKEAADPVSKHETNFAGLHVKPIGDVQKTDVEIIKYLAHHNLLFAKEKYEHSYPHCWRCETPLINYATTSWFVSIEKFKKRMIELAKDINWSPKHIKEGRWGKWLEGARDWSISRQRFWASVMPVWKCEKCKEIKVIGSIDELRKYSNEKITKIIFVRHGESEMNLFGTHSISKNKHPLTKKGIKQAEELAKKIKKADIDVVFSSETLRTMQTSEIIKKELKKEIIIDKRIMEYDFGDWNEKSREERYAREDYRKYKELSLAERYNYKLGGNGETRVEVVERVREFIKEISKNYSGKNVLIVSHGGIHAAIKKILEDIDYEQYFKNELPEHGTIQIFYTNNKGKSFDLHKHIVDKITFKCEKCQGEMKRIPDVLDTWFDSGSMPYAQLHYPFENKETFEKGFPAEFIAEGVDQTRAWFYYLHVIASAVKNSPAFKNVVVNGIVLAEDGKKMSKRLNNYPDPTYVMEKYGSDALRYYLATSPVMQAENINFKETELSDLVRGIFRMLWNSYSFFVLYANIDKFKVQSAKLKVKEGTNLLDRWIVSELQILIKEVNQNMEKYELTKTARLFLPFIDNLSNWYIRRSRKRFWKSENDEDKNEAYATLHYVLVTLAKLMAPFTPFVAEEIWKNLTNYENNTNVRNTNNLISVHLADFPQADKKLIDKKLNEEMAEVRAIISEGLQMRAKAGIKVRQPLAVSCIKYNVSSMELKNIIKEELNVKEVKVDKSQEENIVLDTKITEDLKLEGVAREIIRHIQEMRKEAGYQVDNRIQVCYDGWSEVFDKFGPLIAKETLADKLEKETLSNSDLCKKFVIEGEEFEISLKK